MKVDNGLIYFIILVQEVFKEPYRIEFDDDTLWIRVQTKLSPEEVQERISFCTHIMILYHLPLEVNLNVDFI